MKNKLFAINAHISYTISVCSYFNVKKEILELYFSSTHFLKVNVCYVFQSFSLHFFPSAHPPSYLPLNPLLVSLENGERRFPLNALIYPLILDK